MGDCLKDSKAGYNMGEMDVTGLIELTELMECLKK